MTSQAVARITASTARKSHLTIFKNSANVFLFTEHIFFSPGGTLLI